MACARRASRRPPIEVGIDSLQRSLVLFHRPGIRPTGHKYTGSISMRIYGLLPRLHMMENYNISFFATWRNDMRVFNQKRASGM